MLVLSDIKPPATADDDLRLGHLITEPADVPLKVVLVGFPSDEGISRNGGRAGAAEAPDLIRQALYKLTPDAREYDAFQQLMAGTLDAGDVAVTGDVETDQQALGSLIAQWLADGIVPIVLGGGHETAFGHFLGYVKQNTPVDILNIDAHADVRPLKNGLAHSGSPFYQALEHPGQICGTYSVLGLAPWSVSHAHLQYLESKSAVYCWQEDVTTVLLEEHFGSLNKPTMVTLDMDAVEEASAPGVSAPAAIGLSLNVFCHAAYLAGKSPFVSSVDLVEVSPPHDVNGRTTRAAALVLWHFLRGLSERFS